MQAENANAPHKSSDSEIDRLQDIQEEPRRCIEENSRVNNRMRRKKLFEAKKEEESEK